MKPLASTGRAVLLSAVVSALVVAPSGTAVAATSAGAVWPMQELGGRTVMQEASGGVSGRIGSQIRTGYGFAGGGRSYDFWEPAAGIADREYLVVVPHSETLDPGSRDMDVEVHLTSRDWDANVVGKGQNGMSGGRWKFDLNGGQPLCVFEGDEGWVRAKGPQRIDDGLPHVVRCEKRADHVSTIVDGVVVKTTRARAGSIASSHPLAIGGKYSCDAQKVECDYFTGRLGKVKVRIY